MKKLISLFLVILSCSAVYASEDEVTANGSGGWNFQNNPYRVDKNFVSKMNNLPLKGDIGKNGFAWPGNYWPNNKGGIAHRWRAKDSQDFKYVSPAKYQLFSLSPEQINELSPAEKYDIYTGNYDYPLVNRVFSQTSKSAKVWHGICHGVAPSSIHHKEPQTVNMINKDGVSVTFYASDVKALLAYYYAKDHDAGSIQIGSRCSAGSKVPFVRRFKACNDVNAGAFHMMLSNLIGLKKQSFIADMDRYKQVWNHAVNSFESRIVKTKYSNARESAHGTARRYKVKTKVVYSASIDPTDSGVLMTKLAKYDTRTYVYWLDVNSKNEIIGGSWESSDRPDFLWVKPKAQFTGKWQALNEIYSSKF